MSSEEFNLIYIRKTDRVEFKAKRVCDDGFVLWDHELNLKVQLNKHALTRDYEAHKKNWKARKMVKLRSLKTA